MDCTHYLSEKDKSHNENRRQVDGKNGGVPFIDKEEANIGRGEGHLLKVDLAALWLGADISHVGD